MKHRDSQKRIYINNAIYFMTTDVNEPLFLFKEDLFCELFVADLELCRQIKQFNIFGYKVNPDHVHMLIQPTGKNNYSEIMRSLKTNFSRDANYIMGFHDNINISKVGTDISNAEGNISLVGENISKTGSNILKAGSRDPAFENTIKNHHEFLIKLKHDFVIKNKEHNISKFQWQPSFHDHIIRNKADYYKHLNYIKNQWKKHELKENRYCFISKTIPDISYTKQLKFA